MSIHNLFIVLVFLTCTLINPLAAAFKKNTGLSAEDFNGMTIFDIVHPDDLSRALDLISRMIVNGCVVTDDGSGSSDNAASGDSSQSSFPSGGGGGAASKKVGSPQEPLVLRSSFHNRPDLGLCIKLIRGEDSAAKSFIVTIVENTPRI